MLTIYFVAPFVGGVAGIATFLWVQAPPMAAAGAGQPAAVAPQMVVPAPVPAERPGRTRFAAVQENVRGSLGD